LGVSSLRHEFLSIGMEVIPVKLLNAMQSSGNVVGVVYCKSQLSENHINKQ
jgi:hypothetical protein